MPGSFYLPKAFTCMIPQQDSQQNSKCMGNIHGLQLGIQAMLSPMVCVCPSATHSNPPPPPSPHLVQHLARDEHACEENRQQGALRHGLIRAQQARTPNNRPSGMPSPGPSCCRLPPGVLTRTAAVCCRRLHGLGKVEEEGQVHGGTGEGWEGLHGRWASRDGCHQGWCLGVLVLWLVFQGSATRQKDNRPALYKEI
jgi:hypothetical protein